MKVLVVGSGGREHTLVWKLAQSPRVDRLFIAPGNAGTSTPGDNVSLKAEDVDGIVAFAKEHAIDLTVVGPEAPLVAGLVDRLAEAGLKAFGPTAAAARIEGSKAWANDLMARHGIPTAASRTFVDSQAAIDYVRAQPEGAVVVKADGLAAGKGVVLPESHDEAAEAIRSALDGKKFGEAGATIVIEERLSGPEVSVFAFLDGEHVSAEIAACDYKRVNDGDEGPNTGGMGAYSPPEFWTPDLAARVRSEVLERTARALVTEGCPYRGVLYAGLMVTDDGPKVIEFNCRFGDPETEIIVPALQNDLAELCMATADGRLAATPVAWDDRARVAVVMASGGYPGSYATGVPITGIEQAEAAGALVFHAGTALDEQGRVVTSGGRVLVAVGSGDDIAAARDAAYAAARTISFDSVHFRTDIAARALATTAAAGPR